MNYSNKSLLFLSFCKFVIAIRVTVKQGVVDGGVELNSRNGTKYYAFYGLPFAKPPVDELRFEPPQEPDSWEGVRNAKIQPPFCLQVHRHFPTTKLTVHGQEDCLYMNIFTPNINGSNLLPVIVFIYGGAFSFGATFLYDPWYLMDHPVLYVGIQHRHAIFGFLSAQDEVLPGNYGMKDQVAALRWIKANIAAFGGDPELVTIAGFSSGAMSVHLHLHSPLSAGLFQRAICFSGTAHTLGLIVPPGVAKQRAQAVGTMTGCLDSETKKLVQCLRKVPAADLAFALHKFYVFDMFPKYVFGIVVEPESVEGAFLVKNPWQQDVISKVPLYMGINSDEGCMISSRFLRSPNLLEELNNNAERLFPMLFHYADWTDSESSKIITASVKDFYFNNEDLSLNNYKKLIQLFSDTEYDFGSLEAARRYHNNRENIPVYFYLYSHRNNHSFSESWGNTTENYGVCHADNMIGLMYMNRVFPAVTEGTDMMVSQRTIKYLVNFMYNGDPNESTGEKFWLPIQSKNFEYLHIRTDSDVMEENLRYERYIFWRNILSSKMPLYFDGEHIIKTEL